MFLPGESHGQRSLGGYDPWGPKVQHISSTKPPPPPNHWTARGSLFLQIKFYCDETAHLFTYCLRRHACYRYRIVFGTKITLNHKSKTIDYLALYRKETKLPGSCSGATLWFLVAWQYPVMWLHGAPRRHIPQQANTGAAGERLVGSLWSQMEAGVA